MKMVTGKGPWTDARSPKAHAVWGKETPAERAKALKSGYYITQELADLLSHVLAPQDQRMQAQSLRSLMKRVKKFRSGWFGRRHIAERDDEEDPLLDAGSACVFSPGSPSNGTASAPALRFA
jgi:hypothetical protein